MTSPIDLVVGSTPRSYTIEPQRRVHLRSGESGPVLADVRQAAMEALTAPFGFAADAPLRRCVTPDDKVAIVLDERLPKIPELLGGILDHLQTAGIPASSVTIIVPPGGNSDWVDALDDAHADVTLETHDSEDKSRIAYLATTKAGRRVYLNRTLVEADCVVVLSGRRYDPTFGYTGGETSIFPTLSDPDSLVEFVGKFSLEGPGEKLPGTRREPHEVGKLLSPYYVQVIEGPGDSVQEIIAGLADSTAEGVRHQNQRWRGTIDDRPDLVIAAISGDSSRIQFQDYASAIATAARVVIPEGRILLLADAAPRLEEGAELLRGIDEPDEAPRVLHKRKPDDWPAAALWAFAANQAKLSVECGWDDTTIEELFASPLHSRGEVERLIANAERVLVLQDAHKWIIDVT